MATAERSFAARKRSFSTTISPLHPNSSACVSRAGLHSVSTQADENLWGIIYQNIMHTYFPSRPVYLHDKKNEKKKLEDLNKDEFVYNLNSR